MSNNFPRLFLRCGFTLIELLVVVAIVAVLSAIALPNFLEARARAEQARCASNLKAIAIALQTYKVDHNRFPLADGMAGEDESMGETLIGMGPAANGSWDGVPRVLVRLGHLGSAEYLFCPHYRRQFRGERAQFFRYAYNNSAADTGGSVGGSHDVERDSGDLWYCRCLWVPPQYSFRPGDTHVKFPHGPDQKMENVLFSDSRVVLRDGLADYEARHRR